MTVIELVDNTRTSLEEFLQKWKFKKANWERAKAADRQAASAKCYSELKRCKKDFDRMIQHQSRSIAEGISIGADTAIQTQILWDAAIGYMMVKDAIFALESINSFDSVSYAYETLGIVLDNMNERKSKLPKIPKFVSRQERNSFGYLRSNEAMKRKEELLDSFFDTLKRTGDIEACLDAAKTPVSIESERRTIYVDTPRAGVGTGSQNNRWSILDAGDDRADATEIGNVDLRSMDDIHPPTE